MDFHAACGSLSMLGGLCATVLYVRETLQRKVRPHAMSWFIWSLLTSVAAAVAYAEGATVSFYANAFGAIANTLIFLLAVKYGERRISIGDWSFFIAALCILPLWLWTRDAFWAAFLASSIDFLGAAPTFRKVWIYPKEESVRVFSLYTVTGVLGILAVSPLNATTALYPTTATLINVIVVILIFLRQKKKIVIER